ncbi:MAG: arginine--tRNA ligase [Verrucomicrobia subdivision 3 bacterium]|nr:arginine--tRNA ligase [Limisphaerales bacterium]
MLHLKLEDRLRAAVSEVIADANSEVVQVRPCPDPKFGDYQTTSLMTLAKQRKMNPRQFASEVLQRLDVSEWCESVEIAGAGFLNFRVKNAAVAAELESALKGGTLFFQRTTTPRTIVIDFSSPNVAKPMHVGHIRSTLLGDSLGRLLRLLGHRVITDNHIGDWGTQFGMLIVGWKRDLDRKALEADPVAEMDRLYKKIYAACETDLAVREQARQELVKLQRGDETNRAIWREMIALSQAQFDAIYRRLGVKFDHTIGESFYNPQLQATVDQLRARGIARESEGALAVFFEHVPALKEQPALIQKSDGGFNYTTTDLATLEYRLATWKPDDIVYVTDGRQQLHFQQLFAVLRQWHPEAKVNLAHVWFGSILGEDGKPFKTRTGENVKLADLLDEAEERAFAVVTEKSPELPEAQRREIARAVGISAVKYADLLPNRQSDYVFSWEKMLAMDGNTAVYLLYAYARIRSIFRKGSIDENSLRTAAIRLEASHEIALGKHLLKFGLVLEAAKDDYRPNFICNYLYDLASIFAGFFENCPVLKSEAKVRESRSALCLLTGSVLKQGLEVLGIKPLEQM